MLLLVMSDLLQPGHWAAFGSVCPTPACAAACVSSRVCPTCAASGHICSPAACHCLCCLWTCLLPTAAYAAVGFVHGLRQPMLP
jgi:hypothetical protein